MQSKSTSYRNEGNTFFKKYDPRKSNKTNQNILYKAISLYTKALKLSNTVDEIYKSNKNLGLSYERMLNCINIDDLKTNEEKFYNYFYILEPMCEHYSQALLYGSKALKSNDYDIFYQKVSAVLLANFTILQLNGYINTIQKLTTYFVNTRKLYYTLMTHLARFYFNHGLNEYNKKNYSKSKGLIHQSMHLIQRNYKENNDYMNMDKDTIDNFEDLIESCNFYLRRSTVEQLLLEGDNYLNLGVNENDELDMTYIYLSLEAYRTALNQLDQSMTHKELINTDMFDLVNAKKENLQKDDIELEAICLSRLGKVLYRIFKSRDKAKKYLSLCIGLALSLEPKNVTNEKWFKEANSDLKFLQMGDTLELDAKKEKEEEEFKAHFSEIFKEIRTEHDKGRINFLKFILNKYPYKGYKKIDDISDEYCKDKKTFIRNLCVKYHPDRYKKVGGNKNEKLNYYIMEEISKYVNDYYTEFKEKETADTNDSSDNIETNREEGKAKK